MKLVVACNEFSSMLSRLQGFLGKSQLSPILSNVLLEAKEDGSPSFLLPTLKYLFKVTSKQKLQKPVQLQ